MCGRFTLRTNFSVWSQQFLPQFDPGSLETVDFPPRFNVAPTQSIPCVLREATGEDRKVGTFRWGLVPSWAKDLAIGNRMINARGETVDSKPSFRRAFAQRRCVIPADGYFEWKKVSDGKQPYLMEVGSKGVFAMAGLWEENRKVSEDGSPVRTCTIITTSANSVTKEVHDRMPVILEPGDVERWLDPGFRDTEKLKELLQPAPDSLFDLTPVSGRVNSPRIDDPECVEPISQAG